MTFTEARETSFPEEVPVDPTKPDLAVFVSQGQGLFAPEGIAASFERMDQEYAADREDRLRFMARSVMRLDDPNIDISFVYHGRRDERSRDLMVVFSPLNDGRPESSPEAMAAFVAKDKPSRSDISKAKPNSWSPATKLDIDYQFGHIENVGMPRLQIFAPEAQAFSRTDRRRIVSGDMTPYADLVRAGLKAANDARRKTYGVTEDYERLHFFAAGMSPKALGAAINIADTSDMEIGSVTAMNLAIGEQSIAKLSADYAGRRMVGDAAKLLLPEKHVRIPEPLIRREIDGHGAEFAMRLRQLRVLKHFRMARGIMRAEMAPVYIEQLLEHGATVTVANSFNESMVSDTDTHLPKGDSRFRTIDIVGVEGKKVGMMANEHAALVALVNGIGLKNYVSSHQA